MKKLTIFLRFSLSLMLFFLTLICFFLFPAIIAAMLYFKISLLKTSIFGIGIYASALGAYIIIFFAWRLLYLIDTNRPFSSSSLFALNKIKLMGLLIAGIYTLLIPIVIQMSDQGCDEIGFIVNIFLIGLGITIGVFANLLERICYRLIKFQTENELTI